MITDKSGLPSVGLALIKNNLDKLKPPKAVILRCKGGQQVVIEGPAETIVSFSFGWGRNDDRTQALSTALTELGWYAPVEKLIHLDPELMGNDMIVLQGPYLPWPGVLGTGFSNGRGRTSAGLNPFPPSAQEKFGL